LRRPSAGKRRPFRPRNNPVSPTPDRRPRPALHGGPGADFPAFSQKTSQSDFPAPRPQFPFRGSKPLQSGLPRPPFPLVKSPKTH
jgi:hypothetical protein